ncbi:sigma 54-interacting transcriptional regulator [Halobacillus shinanisalinarum]|uniref:Sigma 54-interacting transcriptional regulator n=1 Tax=Halobacillus shinanisalinarum TaxID=2932258 RepID=A0ABY4H365_9BACI|nr:sigma 54-interacting transcriptional regulator [Halobacillus shinanisalinarum]UOQ94903.1 sigma 54-interacting transcriptional regulator [Halobacillus shinanisalinarum]
MKRRLIVIGIQEENLLYLNKQLEYIFDGMITIKSITLKELNFGSISSNDIVLLSAVAIQELVRPFLPDSCVFIVAKRTENVVNMKELLYLESGKRILVVNDNYNDTMQTVDSLREILPSHIYYPYVAQKPTPKKIDFVVTPGETNLIPKGFPHIIDIGPRVISIETLIKIKQHFLLEIKDSTLMQLYIKTLVYLTEKKSSVSPVSVIDQNQHRTLNQIITKSSLLKSTIEIAYKISLTSNAIHIEGGIGTGKQMLAEMIHNESSFSTQPFYAYNCLDKEPGSIEEELFGSKDQKKKGIINSITGGTLYVKNIDQLPYSLQGNLFSLIEMNTLNRKTNKIRIITSSLESLTDLLKNEIIRIDIYSYISSYVLKMPSLSERKDDIAHLVEAFKNHFNRKDLAFSNTAMEAFYNYQWPGNVRELYNVISYCVCLNNTYIKPESLPLFFRGNQEKTDTATDKDLDIKKIISEIETHGFLSESISLLRIYKNGKDKNESYGRRRIKEFLLNERYILTDQQLRLRIEVLNKLGLLIVRKGRAGTTISAKGEHFLNLYSEL